MSQKLEPMGVEFCKGDVALGSGCLRCGRCAVQLAGRLTEAQRLTDHWKSNHDTLAARLRVFTQRPDIPANLADRLPWYRELVALQGKVARLKAGASVPEFHPVAARKLESLKADGYEVTGYAIERPVEGGQSKRGFIDAGGFVGWWRGDDEWNATVAREVERKLEQAAPQPKAAPAADRAYDVVMVRPLLKPMTITPTLKREEQPQSRVVARMGCPVCKGDSGYMVADPVVPGGGANVPVKAQYKACARCDAEIGEVSYVARHTAPQADHIGDGIGIAAARLVSAATIDALRDLEARELADNSGWLAKLGSPIECYYRYRKSLCDNFTASADAPLTKEPERQRYACPVCSGVLEQEAREAGDVAQKECEGPADGGQ